MTSFKKSIIIGFVFFGFILLISLTTFFLSLGECAVGYFSCDNATVCLPQKLVCDFHKDCKDASDEEASMCGNNFGSRVVVNNDFERGRAVRRSLEERYRNITTDYSSTCILDEEDISENCKCSRLHFIKCYNFTSLPPKFPQDTAMIDLSFNGINLNHFDDLGVYRNLSYLDLRNNNIQRLPRKLLHHTKSLGKLFLQHNKIDTIPHGFLSSLKSLRWLLLHHNRIYRLDATVFEHLQQLQLLDLSHNELTLEEDDVEFPKLVALNELFFDYNRIEFLNENIFHNLENLTLISVRNNRISYLSANVFTKLTKLIDIRLSGNPLKEIESNTFANLLHLNALHLDYTNVPINDALMSTINVSFLSLKGISYDQIDFDAIERVGKLEHIVYKKFFYCSRTARIKICYPKTDGLSSTTDLLDNKTLRYAVWFMALLSCIGNMSVLWSRLHDENRSVSLVIRNLAFSDMIMGLYLLMIGLTDARFRSTYHENIETWVKSWECALLGMIAMASSEVSIFILTFMSIERFLLISDPFGHHKLDTKVIVLSLFMIWVLGVSTAVLPAVLFHSSTKFYGVYNTGTCFPLFIEEVYSTGWIYSAVIFLGINLILLLLIATLYAILLFSIFRTRRATSLNFFDCEVAIRFFFIILTDACCWAPIIIIKLLVLYDIEISGDIYSYLCIFVLPLNSTANPFLWTYSTQKYRDKIFSSFQSQSRSEMNSNQVTADDSQTKVSVLLYNTKNNSTKWKIFKK